MRFILIVLIVLCLGAACASDSPSSKLALAGTFPWSSWEYDYVFYPAVVYDAADNKYKMFYSATGVAQTGDSMWDLWHIGIATCPGTDTFAWSRIDDNYEPVLRSSKFYEGDVVNPPDQKTRFDYIFAYGACVIKDGAAFKMWYTGWNGKSEHVGNGITRKLNQRIGYATSPDGMNWTKLSGPGTGECILDLGAAGSQDAKGVGQPYVIKEGDSYRMWYEGFDGSVWRIFYAVSPDGIKWTKQGAALNPGETGSLDQLGARNPVVITRKGKMELWYEGQSGTGAYPSQYHVLRAVSADNGASWTKEPTEVSLHPVKPNEPGDTTPWDVNDPTARVHVDSIIKVQADGSCQVFYDKQVFSTMDMNFGKMKQNRYWIYTEVVNP